MLNTTITSRDLVQHISQVKKAADYGPIFITNRGCITHVLLSINEYQRITSSHQKITDLLSMPCIDDINLDIPPLSDFAQAADL